MRVNVLAVALAILTAFLLPTRAEAQAKSIFLDNHCTESVRVLVFGKYPDGRWESSGWYVAPGGDLAKGYSLPLRTGASQTQLQLDPKTAYVYAETTSGQPRVWSGDLRRTFAGREYGFRRAPIERSASNGREEIILNCGKGHPHRRAPAPGQAPPPAAPAPSPPKASAQPPRPIQDNARYFECFDSNSAATRWLVKLDPSRRFFSATNRTGMPSTRADFSDHNICTKEGTQCSFQNQGAYATSNTSFRGSTSTTNFNFDRSRLTYVQSGRNVMPDGRAFVFEEGGRSCRPM
jgi:hypothetical protein